jgi:hypothetical protein
VWSPFVFPLPLPQRGEGIVRYKPDTLVTYLLNTWVTGNFIGKEVLPCRGKRPVP